MALRTALVLGVSALAALPITGFRAAPATDPQAAGALAVSSDLGASAPVPERWSDGERGVALVPPSGWKRSPATSLNPLSDPPDPVFELARFQLRLGDASLYEQPVPLTSGLVADAKALLSIGLAREGTELAQLELGVRGDREGVATIPGFAYVDEDAAFEGTRTYTRYFFSRSSDRVVVARAVAAETDWPALASAVMAALASVRADPRGENGPAAPLPPVPAEALAMPGAGAPASEASQPVDATIEIRADILARAQLMLGITYVWGGDSTTRGMDCSAYVSRAWDVERYSTDSIWQVSFPIGKEDLRPGDALNLTTGRDPRRLGHVRIFEAWANAERTVMWVFEETPPRSVHRVIAYDDRYQPIRLAGLSDAGVARLIPGTPAKDEERSRPGQTRATTRPSARPTARPTARPSTRPAVRPTATPRPSRSPAAAPVRPVATPLPEPRDRS